MNLLKKKWNVFLLLLAFFFAGSTFAASNTSIPESACGVDQNVVKLLDGEICEQDLSFRMIYKMFPTTIENFVFPIINSEYLGLVPQIEEQNLHIYQSQELIFFEIFKSTNKISYFIISLFVGWHFLFLGLIRTANDGSFLGKSWKTSSVFTKYGILVILLLPVSTTGLLIIHIIILSIIIIGIHFANFFWGVYLNYLQVGEDSIDISTVEESATVQKENQEDLFNENIALYDHNYFFAFSYAKELTLIELCKIRTEKLLVNATLPFATESNINDVNSCMVNKESDASWIKNAAEISGFTSFSHYSNQKSASSFSKEDKDLFLTSNIRFGNRDYAQCQSMDNRAFAPFDYECGYINVTLPEEPKGNVKIAIEESNFYNEYLSASKTVMESDNPASAVESSWNTVSNEIEGLFEKGAVLEHYKHNKSMILKNVSLYFHQMLMNNALIGSSNYVKTGGTYSQSFKEENNFNLLLTSYLTDAKAIAKSIERIGCVKNSALYADAKRAQKYITSLQNGSPEDITDYNTSCLDLETNTPIGIDPKVYIEGDNTGATLKARVATETSNEISNGVNGLLALTNKIKNKRAAIERSFYLSILNLPSNDLVNRLRKEGWSVSGGYMLKLLSEKELDAKLRRSLQNSTVAHVAEMSNQMLPELDTKTMINDEGTFKLTEWFELSNDASLVLDNATTKPSRKDLKYVDASQYINDNIFNSMSSSDLEATGKDSFYNLVVNFNIIADLKNVVGISEDGELSMSEIENCISPSDDSTEVCPMNLTNPILEVSKLGHGLIDISVGIIAMAMTVAVAQVATIRGLKYVSGKQKGTASSSNQKQTGAIDGTIANKIDADESKNLQNAKKTLSAGFKAFDALATFLTFFFKIIIGMAMFLLTIGFTLAYVIPMIPFIAFTIAFISWIVISLEVLLFSAIWLSFLFRLEDSNKASTELYMAGFNFVMQLLFRPSLIVIGIVVGWSMFGIIFMIINFTMAAFMQGFEDTGFLLSYVYGALLIIAYALVIYVSIKQVFNMMITTPNKIFSKIGVQSLDESQEKDATDKVGQMTMAGIASSGLFANAMNKNMTKGMEQKKEIKEAARNESKREREDLLKMKEEEKRRKEKEKQEGSESSNGNRE